MPRKSSFLEERKGRKRKGRGEKRGGKGRRGKIYIFILGIIIY